MAQRSWTSGIAALLAAPVFASPAGADAHAALVERARFLAIDSRCAILSAGARTALDAGRRQARGALARAGFTQDALTRLEAEAAREAANIACESEAVGIDAARAEDALTAWRSLRSMAFPATERTWDAERANADEPGWRVRQEASWGADGRARFGLANTADGGRLALYLDGGEGRAVAARLLVRDPLRLPDPLTWSAARLFHPPDADALTLRAPPDAYARAYWASDRGDADALSGYALGVNPAAFVFPERALADFAALDPRETIAVEIDRRSLSGEARRVRLHMEVGDFAAAWVFVDDAAPVSGLP